MAEWWQGRPVSSNIQDRRGMSFEEGYRQHQLDRLLSGEVFSPIVETLFPPQPTKVVQLAGGPGPWAGGALPSLPAAPKPLTNNWTDARTGITTVYGANARPGMTKEEAIGDGSFTGRYFAGVPQKTSETRKMAGWSDWYSGAMAPPLKVPGGYIPAPSTQPPMSVEEMYQGIIPSAPSALTSVSRPTVPINPTTGMPYVTTVSGGGQPGLGAGVTLRGDADVRRKVWQPNPAPGPDPVPKYQDRLPAMPAGLPLKTDVPGYASARGSLGAAGFGAGNVTAVPRLPSAPVHQLNVDVPAEEGQMYADSMGIPVRSKSGKVYTPKAPGSALMPSGKVAPRHGSNVHDVKYINGRPYAMDPVRGPVLLGGGRPGGLFGMLFGGGSGGGLFGGAPSAAGFVPVVGNAARSAPAPTYTTTPFQEDRFQTTTGAQMPASMNNSRWTTGY